jgi:hypothetical protein
VAKTYVVYRHFTGDVWRYVGVGDHKRAVNFHNRSRLYRDWIKANRKPDFEILKDGHSPEHREKIAAKHRGTKRSDETCANISRALRSSEAFARSKAAQVGRTHSESSLLLMSQIAKSRNTDSIKKACAVSADLRRGRPANISDEGRARRAEALRRRKGEKRGPRSLEAIEKTANANRGRKRSPEARARISAGRLANRVPGFRPMTSSERTRRARAAKRAAQTILPIAAE